MSRISEVIVTPHALARYRQRVAVYADCPVEEVIEAVKQSRLLKPHELQGRVRTALPGQSYSLLPQPDGQELLFVLDARPEHGPETFAVVTVLLRDPKHPLVHRRSLSFQEPGRSSEPSAYGKHLRSFTF